jgi:elongation factor G
MKIAAHVGNPQVSYRESITETAKGTEVFNKIIANKENCASITLEVKPLPKRSGNKFKITANTRLIDPKILAAIERGVTNSFLSGIKYGYEVCDLEATVTAIKYDELTASEFAFEACSSMCFDRVCQSASPVLMEPIMKVEIVVPNQYVGEVIGGLTSRGGIVHKIDSKINADHISAESPLSKMFGYSTALRSVTQGRGNFSMEFDHYSTKIDKKY